MSDLAREYFGDVAAISGSAPPEIFMGETVPLGSDTLRIPIHAVEMSRVADRYAEIHTDSKKHFMAAARFLRGTVAALHPDVPSVRISTKSYAQQTAELLKDIVPDSILTGRLRAFQLESITGQELPDDVFDQLEVMRRQSKRSDLALGAAHMVLSAEVFAGHTLGRVGKFVYMSVQGVHDDAGQLTGIANSVQFYDQPVASGARTVSRGARKSRGRAWWSDRRGMISPLKGGLPGQGQP